MAEFTKVNSTSIRVQTCMHTKSARVHIYTVMSCETYLSISNGKRFHGINSKT